MKTKTSKFNRKPSKNTHPIIAAYFEFGYLKQLYRQGWLHKNIPAERCESVAEHSFGVAVIGMMLAEFYFPNLDLLKILKMSLLHDFGEVYAGDFIPSDNINPEQKHRLERDSVTQIFSQIPNGDSYLRIWEEFESGTTPESKFVRQLDKLEMALQANAYESQGFNNLQDFYQSAAKALTTPELEEILNQLQLLSKNH